jgi:hypothetical protein
MTSATVVRLLMYSSIEHIAVVVAIYGSRFREIAATETATARGTGKPARIASRILFTYPKAGHINYPWRNLEYLYLLFSFAGRHY